MEKTINLHELDEPLRTAVREVRARHTAYVLTLDEEPQAAFVPYEEFRRFRAFQEGTAGRRFDRLLARMARRNARFTEEEVADDVKAALAELDQ